MENSSEQRGYGLHSTMNQSPFTYGKEAHDEATVAIIEELAAEYSEDIQRAYIEMMFGDPSTWDEPSKPGLIHYANK